MNRPPTSKLNSDAILRITNRIECFDPVDKSHAIQYTNGDFDIKHTHTHLLKWVDRFTTGPFWIFKGTITFKDKADVLIFKLGYKHES